MARLVARLGSGHTIDGSLVQSQTEHEPARAPGAPAGRARSRPASRGVAATVREAAAAGRHDALAGLLQRSVARRSLAGPVLQRYKRFSAAPGETFADYKIINGTHPDFGTWHIKYHRLPGLDIFDELHVKFDDPKVAFEGSDKLRHNPYYFFSDDAKVIVSKSWSGLTKLPGARDFATQKATEFLAASPVVSAETYQHELSEETRRQEHVAALKAKEQAEIEAEKAAKAALALKAQEEARILAEQAAEEETHVRNFLRDTNNGEGAAPAFTAYVTGPEGAALGMPWLKAKADWYRGMLAAGWTVEHTLWNRATKAPADATFRADAGWSADMPLTIKKGAKKGGRTPWIGTSDLTNYTVFSKTTWGKAEVKKLA